MQYARVVFPILGLPGRVLASILGLWHSKTVTSETVTSETVRAEWCDYEYEADIHLCGSAQWGKELCGNNLVWTAMIKNKYMLCN